MLFKMYWYILQIHGFPPDGPNWATPVVDNIAVHNMPRGKGHLLPNILNPDNIKRNHTFTSNIINIKRKWSLKKHCHFTIRGNITLQYFWKSIWYILEYSKTCHQYTCETRTKILIASVCHFLENKDKELSWN